MPTTWRPVIAQHNTIANLFQLLAQASETQINASKSLASLANLRPGFFESADHKHEFLHAFVLHLTNFLNTQNSHPNPQFSIFCNRAFYKEFLQILLRLINNHSLRELKNVGDQALESFLQAAY